jgi:hypothetical protein
VERLFFCYSRRLKRALVANGFVPVCSGFNERTQSKFWLFLGTAELNDFKDFFYLNTP